jgi:PAS domain S-box-containing protein
VVAVSLAENDILAIWWHISVLGGRSHLGAGVALLLAAYLIMREVRDRAAATARLVETDAALRASQQRLRALMEHTPLMVTEKDPQGRYTFVNRAFEERLGISAAKERWARPPIDILRPRARRRSRRTLDREVVARQCALQQEVVVASPSGPRTCCSRKFPLHRRGRAVEAVGTIGVDVTDLKQAEVRRSPMPRRWKRWASSPAASRMTSTTCSPPSCSMPTCSPTASTDQKLRPLAGSDARRRRARRRSHQAPPAFGRRQTLEPRPTDVNALVAG